jgi:ATP-dependent Clp protease ATP-binding subunit ClpA
MTGTPVESIEMIERWRKDLFDDDRLNDVYPLLRDFAAKLAPPARDIVGRESEKISLMSSLARPEMCNVILLAPPGTGKAHPNDELIPVADERGYVRVGLLKVGDRVFDEHGEPVTVTGVFPQGIKREYVVVTNYGDQVRCNDEHLWTVRSVNETVGDAEGAQQTMSLREIMDVGLVGPDGTPIWQLPASGALVRQSRLLSVDPYVCGALLGWGVRIDERGYVTVPDEMPDEVFVAIEDHMGWERVHDGGERSTFINRATGKRLTPDEVMTHPVVTSVLVKPEDQRHIPYTYITSSVKDRETVLRALRDSESYRLSQGTAWVVDADMRELERSLDVTGDMIAEVIETGREVEMTCIMVDSETHLYQVGRAHVVTHNTVLVQSCMQDDPDRIYLEVDMAKMIANLSNPEEMAARLKALFDEAESFSQAEGREIVLFIDEFHQVVQLSAAAVEALKPLLAASGSRGIKVIAATTYDEFNAHIASNLPLVERLARINIPQTNREVTIAILKGMAKKYDVDEGIFNDSLYEQIFDYTNRYVPASVQPRKSIRVLDAMVGRHRYLGERMDKKLLAEVLKIEFGVEVEINVDATMIKNELDKRVFSQDFATTSIARRLQLCVAGLNDPSKPMASLLFTGSTGVGKSEITKQLSTILFGDDQRHLIRFDMTEWGRDDSVDLFREELSRQVWATSHCVLLFDEIEKASPLVVRLLLQVLDDGRLSDKDGRQVSFLNTYIVLTTNAGSEIYRTIGEYNADDHGSEASMREYEKVIEESIKSTDGGKFPPELLGRIDAIVPFQPLSRPTLRKIMMKKLSALKADVKRKHGIDLTIDKRVVDFLVEDESRSDSDAGGARDMVRRMQRYLSTEVAAFINEHPEERVIAAKIDGTLRSEDVNILKSDARVVVLPYDKPQA